MTGRLGFPRILTTISLALPGRLGRSLRWRLLKWFPAQAEDGITITVDDLRWKVHPVDNVTERLLFLNRAHAEPESIASLGMRLSGKRILFHDIGGNCGTYCITIAQKAAPGSQIIAFEPNPKMLARLRANIALNGLEKVVEVKPIALSDVEGTATLSLPNNLGEASLAKNSVGVEVDTAPLAIFAQMNEGFDLRALKIDVEGYEAEVLLPFFAAVERYAWPDLLLIEIEHADAWSTDVLARLSNLGYRRVLETEGNALFELH